MTKIRLLGALEVFSGGWYAKADYGGKCTSLLIDSIGFHLMALDLDGTMGSLKEELVQSASTQLPCEERVEGGDSGKLDVVNMSGIFMIHALAFVAVGAYFCGGALRKFKANRGGADSEPAVVSATPRGAGPEPAAARSPQLARTPTANRNTTRQMIKQSNLGLEQEIRQVQRNMLQLGQRLDDMQSTLKEVKTALQPERESSYTELVESEL